MDSSVTSMISPTVVKGQVGPGAFDLKGSFREFYYELTQMLKDYGDSTKDMVINGTFVPASQKYSPYGTLLFNTVMNQMEQRQSTLFNTWTSLYALEKQLAGGS